MSNAISKNDFYSKLLERSKSFVETMGGMQRNRDVLKHNLNVLIDLCHKRLAINDDYHNSDNNDSETVERSLNGRQSEQTLEECIERGEKWLNNIKTSKGQRFKCVFNDCLSRTVYSDKSNALAHVWGHTGHRPYKCCESGCGYSGRKKSRIKEHSLTHTRVKPIKCAISDCDKRLSLDDHSHSSDNSDRNHNNDNEEHSDYERNQNEDQFVTDQSVEDSVERAKKWVTVVQTKGNKTRYECSFDRSCVYDSNSMADAVRHVFTHTNERPFKCDHLGCDYGCRSTNELRKHQFKHLPIKVADSDDHDSDYYPSTSAITSGHKRVSFGTRSAKKSTRDERLYDYSDDNDSDYHPSRSVTLNRKSKARRSARGDRLYECGETGCRYSTKDWHRYREHISGHN